MCVASPSVSVEGCVIDWCEVNAEEYGVGVIMCVVYKGNAEVSEV